MQVIHTPSGAGGRSHVFAIHFHSPANEGIPAKVTLKGAPIPNRSKRAQGTAGASVTSKCFCLLEAHDLLLERAWVREDGANSESMEQGQ